MDGGKGQVKGIARGIGRHDSTRDVLGDDPGNGRVEVEQANSRLSDRQSACWGKEPRRSSSSTAMLVTRSASLAPAHQLRVQSRRATISGSVRTSKKKLGILVSTYIRDMFSLQALPKRIRATA